MNLEPKLKWAAFGVESKGPEKVDDGLREISAKVVAEIKVVMHIKIRTISETKEEIKKGY